MNGEGRYWLSEGEKKGAAPCATKWQPGWGARQKYQGYPRRRRPRLLVKIRNDERKLEFCWSAFMSTQNMG